VEIDQMAKIKLQEELKHNFWFKCKVLGMTIQES